MSFCLLTYSGVLHILCCVAFCFLCLVYPMLPVSLDCLFLIASSVFSNFYLHYPERKKTKSNVLIFLSL